MSTGNAATPWSWDIKTEALLCPIPGRLSNSSKVAGISPPKSSTSFFESSDKNFA